MHQHQVERGAGHGPQRQQAHRLARDREVAVPAEPLQRRAPEFQKLTGATVNVITSGPDPILPIRMTLLTIVDPAYAQGDAEKFGTAPIGTAAYLFQAS